MDSDTYDEEATRSRIKSVWQTIKETSHLVDSLESKENEISKYFKELHDYLAIEEHRLKKPIQRDIEVAKKEVDTNVNELKTLVSNVVKQPANHDTTTTTPDISFQTVDDTTDRYHIDTIVQSVVGSETLSQFIIENSETLFYQLLQNSLNNSSGNNDSINNSISYDYYGFNSNIINNDGDDFTDLINKHFNTDDDNTTKEITININKYKNEYQFLIDQHSINDIKDKIRQTFVLNIEHIYVDHDKQTYIVSTHENVGATLIDITNNNEIDQIEDWKVDCYATFSSMVVVGDHVYIVGGGGTETVNNCTLSKFSLKSKVITNKWMFGSRSKNEEEKEVMGGNGICACYDGNEYIYLINGCEVFGEISKRIDRFSIKTNKFEKFFRDFHSDDYHILSFFYNGLMYSLPVDESNLYCFDPETKKLEVKNISNPLICQIKTGACTDGIGNVYIYTQEQKFFRLNITTLEITQLENIPDTYILFNRLSMVHNVVSNDSSYIYLFGGKEHGNFTYSIEQRYWYEFMKNDRFERRSCGSVIISI